MFTAKCPDYMFYSQSDHVRFCTPNQVDGSLRIRASDTAIVNFMNYKLNYGISSTVLGIS